MSQPTVRPVPRVLRPLRRTETVLVGLPALVILGGVVTGALGPASLLVALVPLGLAAAVWTERVWAYSLLALLGFAVLFVPGLLAAALWVVGVVYLVIAMRGLLRWALQEPGRAAA